MRYNDEDFKNNMNFMGNTVDNIKNFLNNTLKNKDVSIDKLELSDNALEKVKNTMKNNMYATKEDYKEVSEALEGIKAELTYVGTILGDSEGYENLKTEIKANQEKHAEEIKSEIKKYAQEDNADLKEEIAKLDEKIYSISELLEEKDKEMKKYIDYKLSQNFSEMRKTIVSPVIWMGIINIIFLIAILYFVAFRFM